MIEGRGNEVVDEDHDEVPEEEEEDVGDYEVDLQAGAGHLSTRANIRTITRCLSIIIYHLEKLSLMVSCNIYCKSLNLENVKNDFIGPRQGGGLFSSLQSKNDESRNQVIHF